MQVLLVMKKQHILLFSLVIGACPGLILHEFADGQSLHQFNQYLIGPLGQLFLRLIFMIVTPMVFSSFLLGVYQHSGHQGLAVVVGLTLGFTLLANATSALIVIE